MLDDPRTPFNQILTPNNIRDRITELESAQTLPSADADVLSNIAGSTGDLIVDNLIAPAEGVETAEPTDTGFTGAFVSGEGKIFNGTAYHVGGVNAGVLQAGFSAVDGSLVAGAGDIKLNSNGIEIQNDSGNSIKFVTGANETAAITGTTGLTNTLILSVIKGVEEVRVQVNGDTIGINALLASADTVIYGTSGDVLTVDAGLDAVGIGGAAESGYVLKVTGAAKVTGAIEVGGGASIAVISTGTYTPTLANITNVAASTAGLNNWVRVGNMVTVSGRVDIDATAAGAVEITMTLPVASTFAASRNLGGTAAASAIHQSLGITGSIGAGVARFLGVVTDTANRSYEFSFMYQII